ncbi:MAG: phosphonate ABC transporter ATP-binding protein [Burkholderiaceae bacterium]|nr:phosphonate ABC transporter ATP-binding protein [Burkholderiaceae bacterium]MCD8515880.1 phosphonate ABC transporter ATP-binding protein [Burkholderiaceae bacterium]MCD8538099.1 phosphonate ABC transporter ATP-binding protein [Burkholderiaceae bacterium]MCD8565706.1 phosphonate ABC transporter ATP-binding protein [Burkholderiaceae bacterium]
MKNNTPVLSLLNITKSYGTNHAIRNINLQVRAGEFVVLLGPSGSGKSTIFKCISQLAPPNSGEVRLNGSLLNGLKGNALRLERRKIGLIFQQFNLIARLSALQNVLLGRLGHMAAWKANFGLFSKSDRQLSMRALDQVGMLAKTYQRADTLSGGQQQRVAIARVVAQESDLILADEPVASLDPETSRQVLGNLRRLASENGMAILCSLHQVDLAMEFADRIVAIKNGEIAFDTTANQLSAAKVNSIYVNSQHGVCEQPTETRSFRQQVIVA